MIRAIRAETWEQINRTLLASAREIKFERGRMVRLDSTVTAALMHEPNRLRGARIMTPPPAPSGA